LHISNVGLYDSSIKKPVRVKIAFNAETNERLRISKKTGRILYKRKPTKLKREKRGKKRKLGLKDTPAAVAHKVTYQGEDFQAIRKEFEEFIAAKEARERLLVFKE
jgi:ribosomal protein L24